MSLREENEKRDRQLKKEADLFRTGFNAGLDAAVEACENTDMYDEYDPSRTYIEAINKLRD